MMQRCWTLQYSAFSLAQDRRATSFDGPMFHHTSGEPRAAVRPKRLDTCIDHDCAAAGQYLIFTLLFDLTSPGASGSVTLARQRGGLSLASHSLSTTFSAILVVLPLVISHRWLKP